MLAYCRLEEQSEWGACHDHEELRTSIASLLTSEKSGTTLWAFWMRKAVRLKSIEVFSVLSLESEDGVVGKWEGSEGGCTEIYRVIVTRILFRSE